MDSPSQIYFSCAHFFVTVFVFLVSSSKRGNKSPSGPSAYEHHFNSFVKLCTVHSLHKDKYPSPNVTKLEQKYTSIPPSSFGLRKRSYLIISLSLVIFCSSCFFFSHFPGTKPPSKCGCWKPAEQIASSNGEDLLGEGGLETKQRSLDSFQQLTFTWAHEHDNQVKHTFP